MLNYNLLSLLLPCVVRFVVNSVKQLKSLALGKVELPIKLIIVVKSKNCQAYLVCSLFFHPLRCPVDLASSSSWLAQQVTWPILFSWAREHSLSSACELLLSFASLWLRVLIQGWRYFSQDQCSNKSNNAGKQEIQEIIRLWRLRWVMCFKWRTAYLDRGLVQKELRQKRWLSSD